MLAYVYIVYHLHCLIVHLKIGWEANIVHRIREIESMDESLLSQIVQEETWYTQFINAGFDTVLNYIIEKLWQFNYSV